MTSPLTTATLAALALAAAFFGGWSAGSASQRAQQARADHARTTHSAAATASAAQLSAALTLELGTVDQHRTQEATLVAQEHQAHAAGLRSGRVRVSVPATACMPAAAGSAAAADPAPRAELAPEAAIRLDAIATEGDLAIIDLNACLVGYAAARAAVMQAGRLAMSVNREGMPQ